MNKDRYQSTSARRALALLNSPQVCDQHVLRIISDKMDITRTRARTHACGWSKLIYEILGNVLGIRGIGGRCDKTSNRRQFDVKFKSRIKFSFWFSYRRFQPRQHNKQGYLYLGADNI